ncbi:aldose 1-epimerase family protein [Paenibacillus sp.]|uniref:aldose 1-epimerase family protein n=1 Tax=Paenibacillus sp. TaxID=58172 RepID=UPI002D293761|nr:aldose 1-epimerase family protein [Paenibacillus sp.]HZG85406.1 aldose 1-epimerase family protein [Paenibacillus sp.]
MITEGKGKGNEIIQVRNGSGLMFQIAVDRAFDIGYCEFQGVPVSWLSPTGPVAPSYYDKEEREWNRSFEGGLFATCGLTYMGKPSVDQGQALGLHGRISSTPAHVLATEASWQGEEYWLSFKGEVRESSAIGENVKLERTIRTRLGSNEIEVTDRVTNEAFQPVEHMVLYHFNFGYPLLSETAHIRLPDARRRWIAGDGPTDGWERFEPPQNDFMPTVMLHELADSQEDSASVVIENLIEHNGRNKRISVRLEFDPTALPFLTQWKHAGSGRYVMGIEPSNATTEGRETHRRLGTLPYLEPGETKEYRLKFSIELEEGDELAP